MNDTTRRNPIARVCSEHSGLEARWERITEDLKDIRKELRWLTRAVFCVALLVGGAKALDAIGTASVMAAEPVPVAVPE